MSNTKKRKCIVCGKEYEYCNNCRAHVTFPAWKAIYHDENCKKIMGIATEYMAGNITKGVAKSKLENCDLSDKKSFKESVLNAINEIYASKKSAKSEVVKVVEEPADYIEEV